MCYFKIIISYIDVVFNMGGGAGGRKNPALKFNCGSIFRMLCNKLSFIHFKNNKN